MMLEADAPALDSLGICRLYGEARDGAAAMSIGAFQGLAVSPDGDTVLFEVTDEIASYEWDLATVQQMHFVLSNEMKREVREMRERLAPTPDEPQPDDQPRLALSGSRIEHG